MRTSIWPFWAKVEKCLEGPDFDRAGPRRCRHKMSYVLTLRVSSNGQAGERTLNAKERSELPEDFFYLAIKPRANQLTFVYAF